MVLGKETPTDKYENMTHPQTGYLKIGGLRGLCHERRGSMLLLAFSGFNKRHKAKCTFLADGQTTTSDNPERKN